MRLIHPRSTLAVVHDLAAVFLAWHLAFTLRFNFEIPAEYASLMYSTIGWVVLINAAAFFSFRLYRGIWRYASIHDLKLLLTAVGVTALAVPAMFVLMQTNLGVPRSVYVLHPLLLAGFMSGSRLAYRAWKDRHIGKLGALNGKPVVILGGGNAALSLLKDLSKSPEWRVIGLLDDDTAKVGRQIMGAPVLGPTRKLPDVVHEYGVETAIIAMPSVSHHARKRVVELCQQANIEALTVPSFQDLLGGKVTVSQIRSVELDDLLGRDPVKLDNAGLAELLGGKTVMVTGAGGSIGSELCRQIARFRPGQIVLFELSEFALYRIEQEFLREAPGLSLICAVGDVKDPDRVRQVLEKYRPQVVFHAAAFKHVPLMEEENAWQAIRNNVYGTHVVASECRAGGVDRFVLVSTDKAVNPVNVMGASKRLAEMVCQALQRSEGTRFVVVRFGNVLGSAGSVIPKFREQIAAGGPVTVTHPEMTRYFMSIPEATQLVLQAGLMGRGGEIFVLDMGEPVRIVDLANDLIRLSGFRESEIRIVFSGLRAGEKLYEEVLADDEHSLPTPHPKLRIAKARNVDAKILEGLLVWVGQRTSKEDGDVRKGLRRWVPEYSLPAAPVLEDGEAVSINKDLNQ
jgi:FlaA1/EpsC-like NDP-sugar epimerase